MLSYTTRAAIKIFIFACCIHPSLLANTDLEPFSQPKYIHWLKQQSLLYQAKKLSKTISGQSAQWQYSFAFPQPESLLSNHSVWLQLYPASILPTSQKNLSQVLADNRFWDSLNAIGIKVVHLGPIQLAGNLVGHHRLPTRDGWFDRIGLDIDPLFMSNQNYQNFTQQAADHGIYTIGDIIPGHTGLGPDFLLAERAYQDYPGIYDMIEIKIADWPLLPKMISLMSYLIFFIMRKIFFHIAAKT